MKFDSELWSFDTALLTFDSDAGVTVATVLPESTYTAGSYAIPEFGVPDTADGVVLQLPRATTADNTIWNSPSVEIFVRAEVSYNGGPWLAAGGFGAHGGIHTRTLGGVTEAAASSCPINLLPGTNRKVRATATFSGTAKTACGKFPFIKPSVIIPQTGLLFRGTTASANTQRFVFTSPPTAYPMTYIMRVMPESQNSYYTTFFYGNNGTFDVVRNYGFHPYPDPPVNGTRYWEIAANGQDTLSPTPVEYSRFHIQAARVWRDASFVYHEFYYDLPDTAKVISYTTDSSYFPDPPTSPCISVGDAPWNKSNEIFKGVMRGFQFYNSLLDINQILSEITTPGSIATPWYLNLNPTPSDIQDKSGNNNHPAFDGADLPTLWTG
jgi:hypothetical protein